MAFEIVAGLNITKSIQSINAQLKQLENKLSKVNLTGVFNQNKTKNELNKSINSFKNQLKSIQINTKVDTSRIKSDVEKAIKATNTKVTVSADTSVNTSGLKDIDKTITKVKANGATLGETLNNSLSSVVGQTVLINSAINKIISLFHEAVTTVEELDVKITDIAIATNMSRDVIADMLYDYNNMAMQLGTTTANIATSANTWVRQGYNLADTNTLIAESTKLSVLGQLSAENASKNLTTTLKSFNLTANDAVDVVDKLTNLESYAAISSGELADGMAAVASNANRAGIDMDKLLGYIATVKETTGESANAVGRSLNAMFSRMGNIKLAKLDDYEGDGALSNVETVLNGVNIKLRDTNDSFRDFDDVLDEVGNKWNTFTEVQQSAIAKQIAGTQHINDFIALMNNYGNALEYANIASNSSGISDEKFKKYTESIQYSINNIKASFEKLSMNTIDTDFILQLDKVIEDAIVITDKFNLAKGAIVGIGSGLALKGLLTLKNNLANAVTNSKNLLIAVNNLKTGNITELSKNFKNLSISQQNVILSSKQLTAEQAKQILTSNGLSTSEAELRLQTIGLSNAETTATAGTYNFSNALNALKVAVMSNPILVLGTALTAIVSVYSTIQSKQEELNRELKQTIENNKQEIENIDSIIESYSKYAEVTNLTKEDKEELTKIQNNLIDTYGIEADNIDLVNGKYDEQIEKLKDISSEKRKQADLSYTAQTATALKEYDKTNNEVFGISKNDFDDIDKYNSFVDEINKLNNVSLTAKSGNITSFTAFATNAEQSAKNLENVAEIFKKYGLSETETYTKIVAAFEENSKKVDELNTAIANQVNNEVQIKVAEGTINADMSQADIDKLVKDMTVNNNNEKYINALYESIIKEVEKLSNNKPIEITPPVELVASDFDVDNLKSEYKATLSSLSNEFSKNIKSFNEAISDVENGKEISIDTKQNLFDISEEIDLLNDEADLLTTLKTAKKDYINSNIAGYNENIKQLEIEKTNIEKVITANTELRNEAMQGGYDNRLEIERINKALNDEYVKLNSCNDAISVYQYLVNAMGTDSVINDIDTLIKTTDNLINSVTMLSSAYREYNNNGSLSIETALKLIDSGYAEAVTFNNLNGTIQLNISAYKELYKAKIENQIADLKTVEQTNEVIARIKALNNIINNLDSYVTGDTTISAPPTTSSTATTDTKDYYKENAEDNIKALKHQYDTGYIDAVTYYSRLEELNNYYYQNKYQYLDDYQKYEKEVYDGLAKAQKERLEAEKDKITEANSEREKAIELIKSHNELMNAKENKTIRSYSEEKGFEYVQDKESILKSKQTLDKLISEYKANLIDDKIDEIQKMNFDALREAVNKPIDIPTNTDIMKDVQRNIIENIQNNNNNDNSKNVVINIENINTNNAEDFLNELTQIFKEGALNSYIGL